MNQSDSKMKNSGDRMFTNSMWLRGLGFEESQFATTRCCAVKNLQLPFSTANVDVGNRPGAVFEQIKDQLKLRRC